MTDAAIEAEKCHECPVHLPGRQALSGALQGAAGGALAGLASGLLPQWGLPVPCCPQEVALAWGPLAGLVMAGAGLLLGVMRVSLAGPAPAVLAAALLLAGTGAAVASVVGGLAVVGALVVLGALVAVPVGLVGRLLIPASAPQACGLQPVKQAGKATRFLWGAFGLGAWGLAAFGALKVGDVPGDFSHGLCGVWGCLPPLQALAAMHLFWLVVLAPLGVLGGRLLPPAVARTMGLSVLASALLVALVWVGRDVLDWMAHMPPEYHVHAWRRALYDVAAWVDLPALQIAIGGGLCWAAAWGRAGPAPEGQ